MSIPRYFSTLQTACYVCAKTGLPKLSLWLSTLLLSLFVVNSAQAQTTVSQSWSFNDPANTALPATANNVPPGLLGAQWISGISNTLTNGSGSLRIGYNSTSAAYSFAPVNIPIVSEGRVYSGTIVFRDWNIRNGAASGSTRPIYNFGFRSAASTSSSLVADVQFTATATGVDMVVRDSVSTFATTTLPLALTGPLTVTLKIDKTTTIKTYSLQYTLSTGETGTFSGPLGSTSGNRAISHIGIGVSGNYPGTGNPQPNVAPLIDSILVEYSPPPVITIAPPADGRPGLPSNLQTYLTGNRVQANKPTIGGPGLMLMGGGKEVDAAFTTRAYPIINGGDIVVLRASGSNGYQNYLYSTLVAALPATLQSSLQPNSVETILVDTVDKANSAYVANAVAKANMIWLAGGDQSQYIENWRGTALADAVKTAYNRGAVVGGTSAGMVAVGEWMYDPGAFLAATSAEAVANPYRPSMIISTTKLFDLPLGYNLIPEPHFANRDRMGRLLAFMARLRKDARSSLVYGVALDEGTSLFIDKNRLATFQSQNGLGSGYILREDRRKTALVQVEPNLPLIYRDAQRIKLAPGQTFDFARGTSSQVATPISVEGVVPVNPY